MCSSNQKSAPEASRLGQAEINSRDMPELENLRKITNPSEAIELPVCNEELPFVVAIRCNGL